MNKNLNRGYGHCAVYAVISLCAWMLLPGSVLAQTGTAAPALDTERFDQCLSDLRASAAFAPIRAGTWSRYADWLAADASVLPLLDKQPEFSTPVWDYLASLVDDERVVDGRAAYRQWEAVLSRIESRYGVAAPVVVGVWGVESNFGRNLGKRPLLQSLATLSCFGRRQVYFRTELLASLRIVQEGHIAPEKLNGSWAGAFGQTQFMPSTFLRTAVDFDADGRRDIVDSVPDALASTARFLQQAGYQKNQPWGFEVQLPPNSSTLVRGRKNKRSMSYWRAQGLRSVHGGDLPDKIAQAALLLPAGAAGPAFLVGKNFDTLYSYNASENYALAIAHLSDLLLNRQQAGFVRPWPTDDLGLSRAQNRVLQTLLIARGWDIGLPDGMIGEKTRAAIRAEQTRLGLSVDGRAGQRLLSALRKS